MPQRIQRKRTKGWRMPDGTIYVGRGTKWGNPFAVRHDSSPWAPEGKPWYVTVPGGETWHKTKTEAHTAAVAAYRETLPYFDLDPTELRGHDLACWCPLDQPCHADVLLEIANMP